jgi:nucleotide-binding universal stress UspA family protein
MSYRKILAPMTGGARDAAVLAGAFAAAQPFNAHVEALFVRPDPTEAMPFFGDGMSGVVVQELVSAAKDAADRASLEAQAVLRKAIADAGAAPIEKPERREGLTASFREVQGNFSGCVAEAARFSDLVVFGPLKAGARPGLTEAFEAVLLEARRPVLLTAPAPPRNFGQHIALACDGSMTSAHAVTAAMPYLACAQAIEIFTVKRAGSGANACDDVREYLALHGLSCTARAIDAGPRGIGEALLEAAATSGAGLLVLGGYGHSRLREMFADGVTKHIVSHAEIPLFLMH